MKYAYMLRTLKPLKIQPVKKNIKNHDKKVGILMNMMKKISGFLELK
jgi:hypothetical protein